MKLDGGGNEGAVSDGRSKPRKEKGVHLVEVGPDVEKNEFLCWMETVRTECRIRS